MFSLAIILDCRFMVDKGSDLFYNYTSLMEVHKDKNEPLPPPPDNSQVQSQQPNMAPDPHLQQRNQAMQMQQHHHQQHGLQSIHLSEAGSVPGHIPSGYPPSHYPQQMQPPQPYGQNAYNNQSMMNGMVQLQQAPQQSQPQMMGPPGQGGFPTDVYIPPDIQRNPRRTTRANGQQGMYRV